MSGASYEFSSRVERHIKMELSWSVDITRLKKVIIISLLVLFYAKYRGMGLTKIPSLGYKGLVD